MLRRSAARAFAPRRLTGFSRDPAVPANRVEAVDRFFSELRAGFAEAVRRRVASAETRGRGVESEAAAREAAAVARGAVGPARARLEGEEFRVELPGRTIAFLNNLEGVIWIHEVDPGGADRPIELLSAQRAGSGYRLIRKPNGAQRAGFRFTSVPELVREHLARG